MATLPYFLESEVVIHNQPDDFWVSYLGQVYDLTPLAKEFEGKDVMKPLLAYAGKDISHMMDERTKDIRHYVHPITNVLVPYTPHGQVPHIHPQVPTTRWKPLEGLPWWLDPKYLIGTLSKRTRVVRIMNVDSGVNNTILVCCEDKLSRILERFLVHNAHGASYTWKYDERILDMNKTLSENRIPDERDKFCSIGLPEDEYIPALMLYYNDDLTEG